MQQIFNLQLHLTPLTFVLLVFTDLLSNTETYFNIINIFTWLSSLILLEFMLTLEMVEKSLVGLRLHI